MLPDLANVLHPNLKKRRDALRAAKICINSSFNPTPRAKVVHGPVVKAGKCQRCADRHNEGARKKVAL